MKRALSLICQQQAAKLMYRRGVTYAQQQSYRQAIAAFTSALDKGYVDTAQAQVMRGISRIKDQNIEEAIADFDAVIATEESKSPSQQAKIPLAKAYDHRGQLRHKAGNEAGALADWSAAIAHCPTYSTPHYHRALVHLGQGLHAAALADLDAALAADPTLAPAYLQRGNLRHQLGDIPGAVADWEYAACNDFTLKAAKKKLANVHQGAHDAELTKVLVGPLAEKNLTVKVSHSDSQLDIHVHRKVGTGINYYALPDLIREHLAPLHLADVSRFQLIGRVGDVNRPDWRQSYDLYKGQPCPPSNWQTAFSTLFLFPPFAIPAFIQAAQVKSLYEKGRYIESLRASKAVKGLCIAGSITLGFCTLLPLGYAAYDSMKETPTFSLAEKPAEPTNRPYQQIFRN